MLLVARSGKRVDGFAVDLAAGRTRQVSSNGFDAFDMRIESPALVLRQAVFDNMFGHAGISKRVHFHATAQACRRSSGSSR